MTQETYLQQGHRKFQQWRSRPWVGRVLLAGSYALAGGLTAAAGVGMTAQPLALGLICALRGGQALAATLGSILGYRSVWGDSGQQGAVWSLVGCFWALVLGRRKLLREGEWLMPALAALTVSVTGLVFQMALGDETGVGVHWSRVALGAVSSFGFRRLLGSAPPGEDREQLSRRFDVGAAQVRLEIMAGVLDQTQQLIWELPPVAIDEDALLARTRERACGSCPNRKGCAQSAQLGKDLLHCSLTDISALSVRCKKPNRLLLELRRSQEQLRMLRGEAHKRRETAVALVQQYRFLADYLRRTSDGLNRRYEKIRLHYKAEVRIATLGKEPANGDRCQCFAGVGTKYYVVLCDGMGTGMGAAQEGQTALHMLRQMLTAGFPAEYALGSVNALCCLRSRAGAVTVDLAELDLHTGKAALYKWGAAPSVVLRGMTGEKVGTAGPPPGLDVEKTRETVDRLSLRRGEALVLMSDGVEVGEVLRVASVSPEEPLGEMTAKLLELCSGDGADDATVAAIRLHPTSLST